MTQSCARALMLLAAFFTLLAGPGAAVNANARVLQQVIVPGEDRFSPFALTIGVGDTVEWVNMDTDDHTVVTDNAFTTAGHKNINHLLPGTDSNNGQPGKFRLFFGNPGVYVYYCRFHSMLDDADQPIAPGPDGGIPGTPMMGVVTVVVKDDGH